MFITFVLYCNLIILQYYLPYLDSRTFIEFIDVGQGDCSVIKIKNSKKVIMIDTGGNLYQDIAYNKIIPYLKKNNIEEIDTLECDRFKIEGVDVYSETFGSTDIFNLYTFTFSTFEIKNKGENLTEDELIVLYKKELE